MKIRSNLRAAQQLENIGKYSSAILCLEEFLSVNPDYKHKEIINKKLERLKEKLNNEGDSFIQLNFKPLLEISFEFISEIIFGWLLLAIVFGVIYFVSTYT